MNIKFFLEPTFIYSLIYFLLGGGGGGLTCSSSDVLYDASAGFLN